MSSLRGYNPPPTSRGSVPASVEMAHRSINIASGLDLSYLRDASADSRAASVQAWENFRRIGEVRYALSRSARIAGYAQLTAVRIDDAGQIVSHRDSGVYANEVRKIFSPFGGTRGLIERFYVLRKLVGDSYLIGVRHKPDDLERDGYWFLSPSELPDEPTSGSKNVLQDITWITRRGTNAGGTATSVFQRKVLAKDFLGRVWAPDFEFVDNADTPMSALNDICEILHELTQTIKNRLRQRLTHAGLLLIPNEISDAAISGTGPTDGLYSDDKVLNYLVHVMTSSFATAKAGTMGPLNEIPILLKGPAEALEKLRWVVQEMAIQETDIKLRAELVGRILDGLDQQKAATQNMEGQNHWGAWAVSDEERRITVQPDIEAMCHALTRLVLWPALKERGQRDGEILPWRVWYDLSAASVRSNMGEDARQGWDRGWVNADFARNAMGAGPNDMMGNDEYVRWVGTKTSNPVLMLHGLDGIEVDWDNAKNWGGSSGPSPDSPADESEAGPGSGDPGSPDDRDSDAPAGSEPG